MSSEPSIFFSDVNERQGSFLRRTFLLGGATAVGLLALGGRLGQLQVVQAGEYATLAVNNQFNFRLIPPPRGRILDRDGVVVAGNRPSFRVMVVRDETRDLDQTLDLLGRLLPDTLERRRAIVRDVNAAPRFVPVPVKSDLTWDEFARVNLYANELPGVMADMNEARFYPHGGVFAHTVGYVAKVSDQDVAAARERGETISSLMYHPGFRIGRQGVERTLDLDLRGTQGGQRVEVDARGRIVGEDVEGSVAPTPGKDVVLTLDTDIQSRALEVFGEESGGCVVMDIRNGDVLCMMSAPAFDPNLFVSGVPGSVYRAWADYERRPMLDKTIYGTVPPRFDLQDDHRPGDPRRWRKPERAGDLRRGLPLRQPHVPLPQGQRPRPPEHARRHQELVQRLFLPHVQSRRDRPHRAHRGGPGFPSDL
jgi:penicillin-binding protein 2